MKVQTKILLLLLLTGTLFVVGLTALRLIEQRHFKNIAERRVLERDRQFDQFLAERGDQLKVLVEDSALWDDMVFALAKRDIAWATEHIGYQTLATYEVNAAWIYQAGGELFYSVNNRYSPELDELPLLPAQLEQIFAKNSTCHFFIEVPQGWMEVRGATIHQSVDRQLLAFSRKQLIEPRVLDLNELVAEGRNLLQRVIGEHITIELRPEAADARVLADPGQIEQVILNLGVNARDAMLGGGRLTIVTGNVVLEDSDSAAHEADVPPGRYVVMEVCDSGAGMDVETIDRIFEPFFTTKGPGRGTGLGLATVYGIVKQSHGGISVHSELGKGSRFRVYLPLADAPVEPAQAPPPPRGAQPAETILVCEDEEVVRELIGAVLGRAGYTLLVAEKPSVAQAMSDEHPEGIDLLVSDVVMPEMHGPELASHLTKKRPGLRVLYVSGYSESDISVQGVVKTDLQVLHKPFTQDDLLRRVRQILDEDPPTWPERF